ncbi:MAG: hypothetical protein GY795_50050 [Desulfobacterales bacterium]|nr:hypothetical protein [Desulfobacterales bacterium]
MKNIFYIALLSIIFSCFLQNTAHGQPAESEQEKIDVAYRSTVLTLETIIQSLQDLNQRLDARRKEHTEARTREEKNRIEDEINKLSQDIRGLEKDFEKIATGVDLESSEVNIGKDFDWNTEIRELLGPALQELKNMTARPRHIEKLRGQVSYYEKRLPIVRKAIANTDKLIIQASDSELKVRLNKLKRNWVSREQQISNQLTVAQYQLGEKSKDRKSFLESTQDILRIFFKSRGRNLLLALAAFLLFFLALRLVHQVIYKYSPIHNTGIRTFLIRLSDVIYHLMTFLGATSASLFVLYISGDWVLLSLAILFILGLAWTAKQGLPLFWQQGKLMLNLGTIRENERVVYRGIPWKVVSVNLYSYFENPELKSGKIRLPLRDLIGLNSRLYHEDEPWFPSSENDWVILKDGTLGRVTVQTPEMVQLGLRGGSCKTYLTEEFLKSAPENISRNFPVRVTFRIDHKHKAVITNEVPAGMKQMLMEKLAEQGYKKHIIELRVEFKEATAWSLDIEIVAYFSGKVAEYYNVLTRLLQGIAVEACYKNGWVIPVAQVAVHNPEQTTET